MAEPHCNSTTEADVEWGIPAYKSAHRAGLIARARAAGARVNVADHPQISDFIVPSVLDRSPLVVAISTGGDVGILGRYGGGCHGVKPCQRGITRGRKHSGCGWREGNP